MGSSSLKAEVNAFDRLQIVRGRNSSYFGSKYRSWTDPSSCGERGAHRRSCVPKQGLESEIHMSLNELQTMEDDGRLREFIDEVGKACNEDKSIALGPRSPDV